MHFFLAEVMTPFERSEIEKTQVDRFFDLVCMSAGQKDDGDVGLLDFNCLDWVGVSRGIS
jgi:hypothetical protein